MLTHTARSYGSETDLIPTTGEKLTATSNTPWYAMLRDGKYKYIRTLVEGEMEELYDLDADPEELANLALRPDHRELVEKLREKAIAELRRTDAKFVDGLPPTKLEGIKKAEAGGRHGDESEPVSAEACAAPAAASAGKSLNIYWVDVEGGAATLIVTPAGESVLIDSGNPGVRDSNRIFQVATKEAGLKKIDHLITTHYHRDHFGGAAPLAAVIPIGTVWDNAEWTEQREKADKEYYEFKCDARKQISPGDAVTLKAAQGSPAVTLRCLGARQKFVEIAAGTPANEICAANNPAPVDNSDNANSVVTLVSYGDFDFLVVGDLTRNREFDLVCPSNRVGKVDVFQSAHHGLDNSNNPVLVRSLEPRVVVVNNGVTKGNGPLMFGTFQETKSVQAVYQMHKTLREDGTSHNVADELIANHAKECKGEFIKLSVAADGKSYEVKVPATGHAKTYESR